jgi:hypothetical protein
MAKDKQDEKFKKKGEKRKKYYNKIISENVTRSLFKKIPNNVKTFIGYYYSILHFVIAFFGTVVILFSNNIFYLLSVMIIIILDAMAIVFLNDCPLTMLEQKYLKKSYCNGQKHFLQNLGIMYGCNHLYESQLEVLINAWSFTAIKIFVLISSSLMSIQIVN